MVTEIYKSSLLTEDGVGSILEFDLRSMSLTKTMGLTDQGISGVQ